MLRIPSPFSDDFEELIRRVIGCCITVHRALGPGLIEAAYQRAVCMELEIAGIRFECEKACPIRYRGKSLYIHRLDIVVDSKILLELKAVEQLHPVHRAQVLSSLHASGLALGLLINFNVPLLADGVRRVVL